MGKHTVRTLFTYEIEHGDECLEVEFDCELHPENDGIGSYEFWGAKCYDEGIDYLVLDDMKWDKTQFNDEQNKVIEKYIDDNWATLEETITQKIYDEEDYYED
jgi:hypothetical protein